MSYQATRTHFEATKTLRDNALLRFDGVPGYDVYNCSVPFDADGTRYIYGRIERRDEWAQSHTRLFREIAPDHYELVPDAAIYPIEDPFITRIHDEWILGGTHVRFHNGTVASYYCYFYRGTDPRHLRLYTTGPDLMKDIRPLKLPDGRIGIFSRPRGPAIQAQHGVEAYIGYTTIDSWADFDPARIAAAPMIPDLLAPGEWIGSNQALLLPDGKIGVLAHKGYHDTASAQSVYTNYAFVYSPADNRVLDQHILATSSCYPPFPAKMAHLQDCTFTSGMRPRADGLWDLYTGLGDTTEGRTTIEYPFSDFGLPVSVL